MTDAWSPWETGQPYGLPDGSVPSMEIVTQPGQVVIHPPQQFVAGDTWQIQCVCLNADGTYMEMAGAYVLWVLNDSTGQVQNFITATIDNGGIIVPPLNPEDDPNGICYVVVTPSQSAQLAAGYYMDQLTVITSDGITSTVFQGRIQVISRLPALFLDLGAQAALQGIGNLQGHSP